jgi:hypothetical protein
VLPSSADKSSFIEKREEVMTLTLTNRIAYPLVRSLAWLLLCIPALTSALLYPQAIQIPRRVVVVAYAG